MPLLDLSLVTKSLTNVIEQALKASPEAPKYSPLLVSSLPPDKLTGDHTIGLYLYHAEEHATFKSAPPAGSDLPPIRYIPLGLNLYYQLTAHSDIRETGADMEQLLMGLAMKALHDYSSIDDQTAIGPFVVFPADIRGRDNVFRVALMPVLPSEASNYWTAGSQSIRFAAYYQVSVAFLEPEKSVRRPERTLGFGAFSFARSTPFLDTSVSTVSFVVPGETTPRTAEVQPAQAPVGGRITFKGGSLSGNPTTLLIRNTRLTDAVEVGPEWGVSATNDTITAVIQPMLGSAKTLPGVYSAAARVVVQRLGPGNKLANFGNTSNEAPFIVTPRVDTITTAAGIVTVSGGVFQDPGIKADDVQVFLGGSALARKTGVTLNAGEFETTNPSTLRFRWPSSGFVTGATAPLRILVNGAESAPNWVVAP